MLQHEDSKQRLRKVNPEGWMSEETAATVRDFNGRIDEIKSIDEEAENARETIENAPDNLPAAKTIRDARAKARQKEYESLVKQLETAQFFGESVKPKYEDDQHAKVKELIRERNKLVEQKTKDLQNAGVENAFLAEQQARDTTPVREQDQKVRKVERLKLPEPESDEAVQVVKQAIREAAEAL